MNINILKLILDWYWEIFGRDREREIYAQNEQKLILLTVMALKNLMSCWLKDVWSRLNAFYTAYVMRIKKKRERFTGLQSGRMN